MDDIQSSFWSGSAILGGYLIAHFDDSSPNAPGYRLVFQVTALCLLLLYTDDNEDVCKEEERHGADAGLTSDGDGA